MTDTMDDNRELRQKHPAVFAEIDAAANDLAARKYPGIAWARPRRRRLAVLIWPAVAAAAAAAVLLAMFLLATGPTAPSPAPIVKNEQIEPEPEVELLVMELLVEPGAGDLDSMWLWDETTTKRAGSGNLDG